MAEPGVDAARPLVSVIMRSYNDVAFVGRTLAAMHAQRFQDFEILSFDNDSADGTLEIICADPAIRRFRVPKGTYVPGQVLNRAVAESKGQILVFNNADAIPQSECWLENLIAPLREGKAVAVYARQVCRPDADPWVRFDYERCFGDAPFSPDFFSMASSAALRSVFETHPFDPSLQYSEDVDWARRLRKDGLTVSYVPDAAAEHSHNYTMEQARRRFTGEGTADGDILGKPVSRYALIKGFVGALVRDTRYLAKTGQLSFWLRSARLRWVQKSAYRLALNKRLAQKQTKQA